MAGGLAIECDLNSGTFEEDRFATDSWITGSTYKTKLDAEFFAMRSESGSAGDCDMPDNMDGQPIEEGYGPITGYGAGFGVIPNSANGQMNFIFPSKDNLKPVVDRLLGRDQKI